MHPTFSDNGRQAVNARSIELEYRELECFISSPKRTKDLTNSPIIIAHITTQQSPKSFKDKSGSIL